MNRGFWDKLEKPFFVLAPMADVTDAAFRRVIAKYGKPDAMYTQFVSCDGLCSAGREALMIDLSFDKSERPIVAQFFGAKPNNFYECAKLARELGFDGVDINMGCPDKDVVKQRAGAALIRDPKLAREIIVATKEGAGDLPVSIKTRSGDVRDTLETWLPELLVEKPAAIILHARTRKEMSKVPARWQLVKQAVEIANGSGTLILGNGDVLDMDDARRKIEETGCDGIMFGRAIFGNPWLFSKTVHRDDLPLSERLNVLIEHTKLFKKLLGGHKNFAIMKKHFKAYVSGFDGAKELRMELMEADTADGVEKIINKYIKNADAL